MGEVLSFGFNLAVSFPSDSRGSKARIVLLPSRIKRCFFIIMLELIPLHHGILPNALLCSYELNTIDACWIAVDVWSNSSRCRIVSVYLSRTWCLYIWSCLDILITMLNSVNFSTVICSPTVEYLCPQVYLYHINVLLLSYLLRYLLCFYFTLHLYHKNTKNIILSYLSDHTLVSGCVGIDNPYSRWLGGFICFVQVWGTRA